MGTGHVSITLHSTEIEIILAALSHYEQHHQSNLPAVLAENIHALREKLAEAVD
jgi:hypothetical protein